MGKIECLAARNLLYRIHKRDAIYLLAQRIAYDKIVRYRCADVSGAEYRYFHCYLPNIDPHFYNCGSLNFKI